MVRNTNETKNVTEKIKSVRNEVLNFISSGKMRKQLEEELTFDLYELLNYNRTVIEKSAIENGIHSITRLIRYYEKYDKDKFLNFFKENQKLGSWSSYVNFVNNLHSNVDSFKFIFEKKYFTCGYFGYNLVTKKIINLVRLSDGKNSENFSNNDGSIVIFEFERPISFDNYSILIDDIWGELSRLWLFSFVSKKYKERFLNLLLSEVTKFIKKTFESYFLYSSDIINGNDINKINSFLYKYPNCFLSDDDLNRCILKTFNSHWDINYNKAIWSFVNSDFTSNLTVSETKHINDVLLDFLVKNNKTLSRDPFFKKELDERDKSLKKELENKNF